ncbi:MAG: endo-1,4-beta-xylanase [Lentisphaeria bacterium]|nr:endo-1,4-beta-xylanase [Lentisphaeria bacterium]
MSTTLRTAWSVLAPACLWGALAVAQEVAMPPAGTIAKPAVGEDRRTRPPEGRQLVQNGLFVGKTRPNGWLTRATGDLGTFQIIPAEEGQGSNTLAISILRASVKPWEFELRQKIAEPLTKGENVHFSFDYKLKPGYAFHIYWQLDSSPWPKYLSHRISEPAGEWQTFRVTVPVHKDLPASSTAVSLHLAEVTGQLELRNFSALAYTFQDDVSTLPTTVVPTFGGDYYDKDWRDAALARLEKTRKGTLLVNVTRGGKPLAGVKVKAVQTGRPFSIGVEVPAALLVDGALDAKPFQPLAKRLGDNVEHLAKYRSVILGGEYFDTATLPRALVWSNQAWGKGIAPPALKTLRKAGLRTRGHAMLIPAYQFTPPKLRRMAAPALNRALAARVRSVGKAYKNMVDEWNVLHAVLTYDEVYEKAGVECLVQAFRIAQNTVPDAALFLSDDRALRKPSVNQLEEAVELVNWLRSEGVRIDGLALSASLVQPYIAPQAMQERLDIVVAKAQGLPVYITSLQLDVRKERDQAHMLKNLMLAFYSNPAVRGVSFANVWEAAAQSTPKSALFRKNMVPKPAAKMLRQLLDEEWRTVVETETGAEGGVKITGYQGTYEVSVVVDGKALTQTARLSGDNEANTVLFEVK